MPANPGVKPIKPLKPGMGLYQVLYWPKEAAAAGYPDKPWAVVNLQTRDVNGRWHTTQADALAQARALYARLGDKAKVHSERIHNAFFCFADTATIPDVGLAYIEAIAAKTYSTPAYGDVPITPQKLQRFVNHFHNNTRGQEIAINYDHGADVAKGNKASGWIRDVRLNGDKLVLGIEFTEPAKQELKNKEWRYFSLEWEDEWVDNDGNTHEDVIVGGGLTNRPVAKNLMPINFSEIFVESLDAQKEFAVWTTAYVDSLPDSSFAWVSPDGKRHLPYKDKNGNVDLAHVRNMLARVNQVSGIPPAVVARVKALGARLLGNTKSASEFDFSEDVIDEIFELEADKIIAEVIDESKEWEHSEPGTGTPPAPRQDGDGSDDPALGGGWRRNTPPVADPNDPAYDPSQWDNLVTAMGEAKAQKKDVNDWIREQFGKPKLTNFDDKSKGGKVGVYELSENVAAELLRVLELPVDANGDQVLEAAKIKFGELAEFKKKESRDEQEKQFAERYPEMYAEHRQLMVETRGVAATKFSESVSKIRKQEGLGLIDTRMGLSALAKQKLEEAHVKFAEGTGELTDFEDAIKAVTNGGIVQFGEVGSNRDGDDVPVFDTNTPQGVAASKKAMSELMQKYMKEHNVGPDEALAAVSEKHPELAQASTAAIPG